MTDPEDRDPASSSPVQNPDLLANIIRSSVDGVLAFDRDCRYTVWNPAMERISGVSAEEVLGRCAFDVFPFLKDIGEDWYFHEALAGRQAVARDRAYTIPETGHSGYFEGRYIPMRGASGEVLGGLAIIRDITDLKDAQSQLVQASKLAAMGELGAGVAHELNQPLTSLTLLVGMLKERAGHDAALAADLELIAEQLARMGKIVDNVRAFARKANFRLRPTAPAQPVRAALALLSETLRLAGIQVVERIDSDLPSIHADGTRLQQVFLNLLNNSLHALEGHAGKKVVEIGARAGRERVDFWVEDSGPGIHEDALPKVFEPFFTTKGPAQGTGLGLSLCYGIVREHAGDIKVMAGSSGGARVELWVPVARRAPTTPAPGDEGVRAARHPARILVVDDELVLRRALADYLKGLGYQVDAVESAEAALGHVEQNPVDLALIDLRMPEGDGRSLFAKLKERERTLPVIVVSGFVTDEEVSELLELGVRAVLHKPFNMKELAKAVAETLQ